MDGENRTNIISFRNFSLSFNEKGDVIAKYIIYTIFISVTGELHSDFICSFKQVRLGKQIGEYFPFI